MAQAQSSPNLLFNEKFISFAQAARMIPPSRQGRPVSPSCIWRWHTSGVKTPEGRRVYLEAYRLVNRFLTSEEAVKRFILAQQLIDEPSSADLPSLKNDAHSRTLDRRLRDSERALNRLQEGKTTAKVAGSLETDE